MISKSFLVIVWGHLPKSTDMYFAWPKPVDKWKASYKVVVVKLNLFLPLTDNNINNIVYIGALITIYKISMTNIKSAIYIFFRGAS